MEEIFLILELERLFEMMEFNFFILYMKENEVSRG